MSSVRTPLRVLVADDRPFGDALVGALAADADLACVARVTDLAEVATDAERHAVDLVLLNPSFTGGTTLNVIGTLTERLPRARILVLSEVASESLARESLRRGAAGFLVHSGNVNTLLARIRACAGHAPAERNATA